MQGSISSRQQQLHTATQQKHPKGAARLNLQPKHTNGKTITFQSERLLATSI